MLNAVCFVVNKIHTEWGQSPAAAEVRRAVKALEQAGFVSGILSPGASLSLADHSSLPEGLFLADSLSPQGKSRLPLSADDILFVCDRGEDARLLRKKNRFVAAYSHEENAGEDFRGVPYVIQEPDLVSPDSYVKIFEREAGLPWTILRTPRCLVREFTEDDLDGICSLYDGQARKYLEAPSQDRIREREILRAYIKRIYGLYGFGHWAVLAADPPGEGEAGYGEGAPDDGGRPLPVRPGTLIGRVGFSAVTSAGAKDAARLGIGEVDADFGFLIAPSCRGTGAAREVCEAILRYGFEELGFSCVSADAHIENRASIHLLRQLGFEQAGQADSRLLFYRRSVFQTPMKGI